MQIGGPRRPVHFQPADTEQIGTLPGAGEAADLLFRIRGISFRCDAAVKRVDELNGGLYLDPAIIEWSVRGFHVGGVAFSMEPSVAMLRRPDGRTVRLPVLSITDDKVVLLGWPVPLGLDAGGTYPAVVLLGEQRIHGLQLELSGAQAIFTGSTGRIVHAAVVVGHAEMSKAVLALVQEPERRAVAG